MVQTLQDPETTMDTTTTEPATKRMRNGSVILTGRMCEKRVAIRPQMPRPLRQHDPCGRGNLFFQVHIHEQAIQEQNNLYRRPKEPSVITLHVRSMPVARSLMLVLFRPDGAAHIPAAWITRPISRNAALANTHLYASPFASLKPTRARPKGIYSQKLA
jgi:hypothetical protein